MATNYEHWLEDGPALSQYESDLSDGLVPCTRFTIDGIGIDPLPFEDWLDTDRAYEVFHDYEQEQYEAARDRHFEAIAEERGARF